MPNLATMVITGYPPIDLQIVEQLSLIDGWRGMAQRALHEIRQYTLVKWHQEYGTSTTSRYTYDLLSNAQIDRNLKNYPNAMLLTGHGPFR